MVDRSFRAVIAGATAVVLAVGLLLVWLTYSSGPHIEQYERALAALQDGHAAMLDQESSLRGFLSPTT